ncbi:MAG: hypothetical protein II272_02095, partial [Oscillospiraceae bacterium]|nr:hypothetical protein [Oscillospiraceae bacterium]
MNGVTVSGYTHGIQNRYSGVCNVNDGVISGPKYGVEHTGATFSLSGNVEITGGTADIFLGSGKTVTIARKLTGSDKYTVCTGTAPTETTPVQITTGWEDSGNTKIPFEYYQPGFMVREMEASTGKTELFIVMLVPHIHCEYGHNCPMGENCTHEKIVFDKILDLSTLPVKETSYHIPDCGNYYLIDNVTLDKELRFQEGAESNICLNGYNILGDKQISNFYGGTDLYLINCKDSGAFYARSLYAQGAAEMHVRSATVYVKHDGGIYSNTTPVSAGRVIVDGGILQGSCGTAGGGSVLEPSSGGIVELVSGEVINAGNGYTVEYWGEGSIWMSGDIRLSGGEADIYLGAQKAITIKGSLSTPADEVYTIKVDGGIGTGYQITNGWSDFTHTCGRIPFASTQGYAVREMDTGNGTKELFLVVPQVLTDTDGNGTLTMTDPTAANVRVGSTITLTATPNEGCFFKELTVTYQDGEGNVVSVPVIRKRNETFTFVMPDAGVVHCYASFAVPHEHYMAVDTEKGLIEDGVQKANWCDFSILLSSYADLVALDKDHNESNGIQLASGSYVLTDSFTCDNRIEIVGKANLCLNGKTLTMNNLIFVASYTDSLAQHGEYELHICDCSAKPESEGNQGEGSIIGGEGLTTNTQLQGLIAIRGNSLYIYGGTFEAHKKPVVYIEKGGSAYGWPSYFNFYGGQIRGNGTNAVYNGSNGAVWIEIRGGLITTNQGSALHLAYGLGGGVIMSGGKVEATGTSSGDHGMHVRHCGVEMTGGEVTAQGGDGINYNAEGGMLDIRGGSISAEKGNGIYISNYGGTSRIYGGSVSSRSAYGIYNDEFSTLEIYGGTVSSYAEAPDNGGGILNQVDASTTVYGGQITATAG